MQKYHIDLELKPTSSPIPQHTSLIENHKDFPPPRNFYENKDNFNSQIYDSETNSLEHSLGYNDQS